MRIKRRQRLLSQHPTCYLCGGLNRSTTIDHVPPRACFPVGYMPEDFEFPACYACNQSSRAEDKTFGFWAMALNFDLGIATEDRKRVAELMADIARESPQEIEEIQRAVPISVVGNIVTPRPIAFEMRTPDSFARAARLMSIKLTHALYFRETKKYLNSAHRFAGAIYQPQVGGTEHFTAYIGSLLPKLSMGNRTNIKNYGNRFGFRSGYKEEDDFFFYAAQFGQGLIAWGIVCGPNLELPKEGPLSRAGWQNGAWGTTLISSQVSNLGPIPEPPENSMQSESPQP